MGDILDVEICGIAILLSVIFFLIGACVGMILSLSISDKKTRMLYQSSKTNK